MLYFAIFVLYINGLVVLPVGKALCFYCMFVKKKEEAGSKVILAQPRL